MWWRLICKTCIANISLSFNYFSSTTKILPVGKRNTLSYFVAFNIFYTFIWNTCNTFISTAGCVLLQLEPQRACSRFLELYLFCKKQLFRGICHLNCHIFIHVPLWDDSSTLLYTHVQCTCAQPSTSLTSHW